MASLKQEVENSCVRNSFALSYMLQLPPENIAHSR
jgi:hypothetical protein